MIVQFLNKEMKRMVIEQSLKKDESIACDNATVIVDKDGNITGWFDNDAPVNYIVSDKE